MFRRFELDQDTAIEKGQSLLERWHIAGSNSGCLWIQPEQHVLRLPEFCAFLKRMQRLYRAGQFKTVVFHFDQVDAPSQHWDIVFRVLRVFARTMGTHCHVVRYNHSGETAPPNLAEAGTHKLASSFLLYPPIRLHGVSVVID